MKVSSWMVEQVGGPMAWREREESVGPGQVLVEVAGCGVCHTDLGFYYEGVPTRHAFPLALGHEISGRVVETGPGVEEWAHRLVIVPAVIPCGTCEACRRGRGAVCPRQFFPGNDGHGGFGTHVRVPATGLCPVPDLADPAVNPARADLAALSVVADAVSTPFQAIRTSGLAEGDLAVFVGVGGVGGFGAQIAAALGAAVVAVDTDPERLTLLGSHGADLLLRPDEGGVPALRKAVRAFAKERGVPTWRTRIFECSGTRGGQETAFALLGHGGHLSIVGFTPATVEVRLSNLMAFDATVRGTWGCLPELYPAALRLVLAGLVVLEPFLERRPLAAIQSTFEDLHAGRLRRRVVLLPGTREGRGEE